MTVNSSLADQIKRQKIGERIAAEKGLGGLIATVNNTVFQAGTQLENHRGEFLWLLANLLKRETEQLQTTLANCRAAVTDDTTHPDMEAGISTQLKADIRAVSALHDSAREAYLQETGRTWRAPVNKPIHSMERGTVILLAGDDSPDRDTVHGHLEGLKDKYNDLILVHTRINETDRLVSAWAKLNKIREHVHNYAFTRETTTATHERLLETRPREFIVFGKDDLTRELMEDAAKRRITITDTEARPGRDAGRER